MLGLRYLTAIASQGLDRLGDFNPQLLRELKGKLRPLPIAIALGLSLIVQVSITAGFISDLPGKVQVSDWRISTYPHINWIWRDEASPIPIGEATIDFDDLPGMFVGSVDSFEPVQGDKSLGRDAVEQIREGDRLIAINGRDLYELGDEPIDLEQTPDYEIDNRLKAQVNQQLLQSESQFVHWTQANQSLIDTTVDLTLYRPDRGQFSVLIPRVAIVSQYNDYCFETVRNSWGCDISADGTFYPVDWLTWYRDFFRVLSTTIVFSVMVGGVFFLASNLADEQRRGTFNFLKLSPRSSLTLLGGKLLGVPILLYGAIAFSLPLQWFVGLRAGYSVWHLLGFDIALISQALVFYMLALLLSISITRGLLLGLLPWGLAIGVLIFHWAVFLFVADGHLFTTSESSLNAWALLFSPFPSLTYASLWQRSTEIALNGPVPMSTFPALDVLGETGLNLAFGVFRINFLEYTALVVLHSAAWCALFGHGIQRRFSNLNMTLLSRRLSYLLTFVLTVIVLGLTETQPRIGFGDPQMGDDVTPIALLGLLYFVVLAIALSPSRQALMDWARFRQEASAPSSHSLVPESGLQPLQDLRQRSIWNDLLVHDASSPLVAIALNLFMATSLFVLWVQWHYAEYLELDDQFVLALLLCVGSFFLAILVIQMLNLLPTRKHWMWFVPVSGLSGLAFPVLSVILYELLEEPAHLIGMPTELAALAIPCSLLGTIVAILSFVHNRQLMVAGRSESQALFDRSRSALPHSHS